MGADGGDDSVEAEVDPRSAGEATSDVGVDTDPGSGWGVGRRVDRFRRRSGKEQALRVGSVVVIVGLVVLVAVVPMGILGLVVTDSATFEADPATVAEETLAETEYEQTAADTVVVQQQRSPAGQERTIFVRNERRTYTKTVQVQNSTFDEGVFVTLSSPSIVVAGHEQNPLAHMSHRELLRRFESDLDIGDGDATFERVGEREAAMLGRRVTVSEFRTERLVDGETQEFAVYVSTVRSDGDIVVVVGLHPTPFADEEVSIMRLLHAVEHSGESATNG